MQTYCLGGDQEIPMAVQLALVRQAYSSLEHWLSAIYHKGWLTVNQFEAHDLFTDVILWSY